MTSPTSPTSPGHFSSPTPLAASAGLRRSPSPTSAASAASPSRTARRSRGASITESIFNARPPPGFCAATGEAFGKAPTLAELRRNSMESAASDRRRKSMSRRGSSVSGTGPGTPGTPGMSPIGGGHHPLHQQHLPSGGDTIREEVRQPAVVDSLVDVDGKAEKRRNRDSGVGALSADGLGNGSGVMDVPIVAGDGSSRTKESDYTSASDEEDEDMGKRPKPGWWAVTVAGLKAFWKWFITPMGFCLTIYMLNIVAWGGMLFLLLCNAAPAMCTPTCNDINSPRRIWIEIDSQILNALFCVTGFGLIPWRFRDLYYLLKWRCYGKTSGYMKLQEIHSAWYRPGAGSDVKSCTPRSQDPAAAETGDVVAAAVREKREAPHDPAVADAAIDRVDAAVNEDTITGDRAPPTKSWKLDYVIWLYCWNTFFQVCLSGFMWGMNRHDRPPWSTGLFVALAFGVAGMAGGQVWWETRKVKRVEGDPKKEEQVKEGKKKREERAKAAIEEEEEATRGRQA